MIQFIPHQTPQDAVLIGPRLLSKRVSSASLKYLFAFIAAGDPPPARLVNRKHDDAGKLRHKTQNYAALDSWRKVSGIKLDDTRRQERSEASGQRPRPRNRVDLRRRRPTQTKFVRGQENRGPRHDGHRSDHVQRQPAAVSRPVRHGVQDVRLQRGTHRPQSHATGCRGYHSDLQKAVRLGRDVEERSRTPIEQLCCYWGLHGNHHQRLRSVLQ